MTRFDLSRSFEARVRVAWLHKDVVVGLSVLIDNPFPSSTSI